MIHSVFASKSMNKEAKPQGIDLMGCCFMCKYETRTIGVRYGIGS